MDESTPNFNSQMGATTVKYAIRKGKTRIGFTQK